MTTDQPGPDAREQAIEQAAKILRDAGNGYDLSVPCSLNDARALADAGLLRTQASPVNDEVADMEDYLARLAGGILARARRAEAERDQLRRRVQAVRALHPEHEHTGFPACAMLHGGGCAYDTTCSSCHQPYPCPTIRALDGAEGGADRG